MENDGKKLFGWTWSQWAIAAGHYGAPTSVSFKAAADMRLRWQLQYRTDPEAISFVGIERKMDHEFSAALFSLPIRA